MPPRAIATPPMLAEMAVRLAQHLLVVADQLPTFPCLIYIVGYPSLGRRIHDGRAGLICLCRLEYSRLAHLLVFTWSVRRVDTILSLAVLDAEDLRNSMSKFACLKTAQLSSLFPLHHHALSDLASLSLSGRISRHTLLHVSKTPRTLQPPLALEPRLLETRCGSKACMLMLSCWSQVPPPPLSRSDTCLLCLLKRPPL